MRKVAAILAVGAFSAVLLGAAEELPAPAPFTPPSMSITAAPPAANPAPPAATAGAFLPVAGNSSLYVIRYDRWTPADERGFGEFVTALGNANCRTVNDCLHSPANPFRASDPQGIYFRSDCADLPYVLRAYYAWKRGLPFSYVSAVTPRGHARDIRYSKNGNEVVERRDVLSGTISGYELLEELRDQISSATYRMHPDLDDPVPDLYSPKIDPKSIRPGTLIYDPNGHVATVYRVDPDGRINYVDAHPDNSMTRGFYDIRFVRSRPGMGAGFKNWRSGTLVGATRRSDGVYVGGHVVLPRNKDIADFSTEQYYGTGTPPLDDSAWADGVFSLGGQVMNYYDFVRAVLAGGQLRFDPVKEIHDLTDSNCAELHYRGEAVDLSLEAGLQNRPEPDRLPANIYGTDGDWETYSTPSRDARLKTAFKELRDEAQRFVAMYRAHDPKLVYAGHNLVADLIATYDAEAAKCSITYTRTDGSQVTLGYEEARKRLFRMSFDPYQCVERRWGATDPNELSTCRDGPVKQAWYAAEQNLRNQIDRTYDAQMDFTLEELRTPGPGKGVPVPPDTDVRAWLVAAAASQSASR
ncbi:MAG: hypothetical protein ACTHLR_01815 [Rhizomicrobium sp.]